MDGWDIWDEPDIPHSLECPRCGIKYPPNISKCQKCGLDLWKYGKRIYLETPTTRVVNQMVRVSGEVISTTSTAKAVVNELKKDVRQSEISDSTEINTKLDDLVEKIDDIEDTVKKGIDIIINQTRPKSRSDKIVWFIFEHSTVFIIALVLSYIVILLGFGFLL